MISPFVRNSCQILVVLFSVWAGLREANAQVASDNPDFLTFDELLALSQTDKAGPAIEQKLDRLLHTPFTGNFISGETLPHRPSVDGLGSVLRVAFWNIERGLQFDLVRLAFFDPEGFRQAMASHGQIDGKQWATVEAQLRRLEEADVLILNEVDLGMKRTEYRDVARELAHALHMDYVYGVEFVEVDRLEDLGAEPVRLEDPELSKKMQEDLRPDPARYRGLHGNAILSRYPIERVSIQRLPVCYDWYNTEKAEISKLEQGRRFLANKIFLERIEREVRLGGRMFLSADLRVPGVHEGRVTIVNAHLENKCKPPCREKQMLALLEQIRSDGHPVILAGDMNTSGRNGLPMSVREMVDERVQNHEFWETQAGKWLKPVSLPFLALEPAKYFKNFLDPTSRHIPIVGSNEEAKMFRDIESFRFSDQYAFDFRGSAERNLHEKGKTLADSNQRTRKGFEPTFTMKRDFGGLVGRYKLDWFFVKAYDQKPRGEGPYLFAPHDPITMRDLNTSVPDGISDHPPMTVDLPFTEPQIDSSKTRSGGR